MSHIVTLLVGCLCLAVAVIGARKGVILEGRAKPYRAISRSDHPFGFWSVVAFLAIFGAAFMWAAFR